MGYILFQVKKKYQKVVGTGTPRGRVLGEGRVRLLRFVSTRLSRSARNDKAVRFAAKSSVGRDALVPPPVCLRCHFDRSEDDSPNAVEKSPTGKVFYSCTIVFVSAVWDFSAVSHRGRAGWRVFVSCRFYCRGFLDFARNDKGVRFVLRCQFWLNRVGAFLVLLRGFYCHFDRSEDDSLNAVEKSPTGKVFYSCTIVFVSAVWDFSAVSHRGRAGWRVFVSCRFYCRGFLDFARNDKRILLKTKTRFRFCRSVFCVYSVKCGANVAPT